MSNACANACKFRFAQKTEMDHFLCSSTPRSPSSMWLTDGFQAFSSACARLLGCSNRKSARTLGAVLKQTTPTSARVEKPIDFLLQLINWQIESVSMGSGKNWFCTAIPSSDWHRPYSSIIFWLIGCGQTICMMGHRRQRRSRRFDSAYLQCTLIL